MIPANGRITRDFITQRSAFPCRCKVKDRQIGVFHCAAAPARARCRAPRFVWAKDSSARHASRMISRGANRQ
ncbi:hypothetical protein EZV77_11705 [Burkholderia thailandensis]|nr:hypothetical protein EZV77_11705 [Burkholderia thailandensis]TGB31131.1 hypothetical protein C6946_24830 [Burkholderia thailandensis]